MPGKRFCPNCGSEDVDLMDGGISGNMQCQDCGFFGTLFPERTLLVEDEDLEDDESVEKEDKISIKKTTKKNKSAIGKKTTKSKKKIVKKGGKKK